LESAKVKEALARTLQREALEAKLEDTDDAKLDEPPIDDPPIEGRLKSLESGTV
jgi:hypothetical protein